MFLGLNPPKSRAKLFSFLGNNGAQYYAGNSQESASSSRKNPLKKIGDTPMRYHLIPSAPKSHELHNKMIEGYLHSEIAFIRFPAKLLAPMRNSLLVIHSAPKISSTMQ